MAQQPLGNGSIQPAAKPVDAFIQPARFEAAAPARPNGLVLSNGSANLVSTAGRPNVPGYNPGEQLAEALSTFSTQFTKTAQMGLQLYASHEYQAGQNEAAKAVMLAERQVMNSAVDYAGATRDLQRVDPMGALAMDSTNPFREAGRQNALSQAAASSLPLAMEQAYAKKSSEFALLDPADPKINGLKAEVISQHLARYGVKENGGGFMDYVLPALNRSWERVTAQHVEDRNNYLKDTVWRTAAATLPQMSRELRNKGYSPDQISGALGTYLAGQAAQLGLRGEPMEMQKKAIVSAFRQLIAAGDSEGARIIGGIPVGQPDENGIRPTAAQAFFVELSEGGDQQAEIQRRSKERDLEPLKQDLTGKIAQIGISMEDGPEKQQAIQGLLNDPKYQAIPIGDRLDLLSKGNKLGEDIQSQGFDADAAGSFIGTLDQQYGFGSKRDIAGAEAELEDVLSRTDPADRPRIRAQFAEWKNKQQQQPWDMINPAINNQIKANLEKYYPSIDQAALRGQSNIEGILQWGDAKSKQSSAEQLTFYREAVLEELDRKRTEFGRDLSDTEALAAIKKGIYNANKEWMANKELKDRLFPAVPSATGPGGGAAPAKPTPPPGTKPSPVQGQANPALLDSMPDRSTRLQNWKSEPILNADATVKLTADVLSGKAFPPGFRRAAIDAGTTPEQLLIRQVELYPNALRLTPQQRSQILKQGNTSQALNDGRQARAAAPSNLLAQGASWAINALMGIQPSYATGTNEINLTGYRPRGGGGSVVGDKGGLAALVSSGEGGWNSVNYGTTGSAGEMRLTSMTIGQVEQLQSRGRVFAVGAYQFTPGVLSRARRDAGLSPSDPMTPENQTRLFWGLAMGGKRPALAAYLRGESNNLNAAHRELSLEWAAIQGPSGRGAYDGDSAGNYASVGAQRVRRALIAARQQLSGR